MGSKDQFLFPESSLEKIEKHRDMLMEKSHLTTRRFHTILRAILSKISLISREEEGRHWREAKTIMEHIDPEDVTIVAASPSQRAIIWSDDKHFQRQNNIPVLTTQKMMRRLENAPTGHHREY